MQNFLTFRPHIRFLRTVGENHSGVSALATTVVGLVGDAAGLGASAVTVSERPRQLRGRGALVHDAVVDGALVLRVGAAVDGEILGEDVDGLVARATEAVGEDVTGVAVLNTIVVKSARIALCAGSGVGSLVQVGLHNGGASRLNHGVAAVHRIHVSCGLATGCSEQNKACQTIFENEKIGKKKIKTHH